VLRKAASPPTHAEPGERIAELSETRYEDPSAEPGEVYWYTVFASRGSILSRKPASADPVVRVADVEDLNVEAGDHCVNLSWKPVPKARHIEVWRQEGSPPQKPGQGARLPDVRRDSAFDGKLTNDKTYGYLVVACFIDPAGKPLYSPGVAAAVTPAAPPKPVAITVERRENELEVAWTAPPAGEVQVYYSTQKPTVRAGERVSLKQLDKLGKRATLRSRTAAAVPIRRRETLYVLPVTVSGSLGVAGGAVVFSYVDDVSGLRATLVGGRLSAQWDWPEGVTLARVALRPDAFAASPFDRKAMYQWCDKGTYERNGGLVIDAPSVNKIHLTVFSCVADGAQKQFSSGASKGARTEVAVRAARRVEYKISPRRTLFGTKSASDFEIVLQCDEPVSLPELKVIAKAGGVPISPDDGVPILQLPAGATCEKGRPFRHAFRANTVPRKAKAKVYPARQEDVSWLELRGGAQQLY